MCFYWSSPFESSLISHLVCKNTDSRGLFLSERDVSAIVRYFAGDI